MPQEISDDDLAFWSYVVEEQRPKSVAEAYMDDSDDEDNDEVEEEGDEKGEVGQEEQDSLEMDID